MESASLDALLIRLRQIQLSGGHSVVSEGASDWYEIMLFPPASDAEISAARSMLGKALPDDFIRFWHFTNGANLFVNDSGLHGVGIASSELIVDLQQEEIEHYGAHALAPYLVFGRVNGSGDFLAFDTRTGWVVDGIHSEQPHEWRPIAAGFTDWLARLLDAQGRYYWLEALYNPVAPEGR